MTLANATLFSVIRVIDLDSHNNRNGCYNHYCNYGDHSVNRNCGCPGAVAVILLIAFLATKELAGASVGRRFQMLGHRLNVGIAPLLMVFGMIVVMKVIEVLT